jgi:hypothetical protein
MKMGKVVETSFHHINGKHENLVVEGRLSAESSLSWIFCEAHTHLILRLTEECKCSLTEEDADAKP